MQLQQPASRLSGQPSAALYLSYAQSEDDVKEAQRLRYRVFAEEMGARLPNQEEGLDRDIFDPFCEHLLVRNGNTGEVVGTYRILPPDQAKRIGGLYSQGEFDLTRLLHLAGSMAEVGRSCVHPDYRSGGAISMLWSGLAKYMLTHGYEYLIGCASISMADGGHAAASLYNQLKVDNMSPIEWRVFPRCPLPLDKLDGTFAAPALLPPLLKGYLRAGAYICGDPSWDPDFNTADFLVLLPMVKINKRYARHFLGEEV
ncbi:MAG TPA: GNAT family N-acetyltransferase [Sulfuricella sp.]|nr:GNAT family N-acetyltransferase [Sulfuricella sp.]